MNGVGWFIVGLGVGFGLLPALTSAVRSLRGAALLVRGMASRLKEIEEDRATVLGRWTEARLVGVGEGSWAITRGPATSDIPAPRLGWGRSPAEAWQAAAAYARALDERDRTGYFPRVDAEGLGPVPGQVERHG